MAACGTGVEVGFGRVGGWWRFVVVLVVVLVAGGSVKNSPPTTSAEQAKARPASSTTPTHLLVFRVGAPPTRQRGGGERRPLTSRPTAEYDKLSLINDEKQTYVQAGGDAWSTRPPLTLPAPERQGKERCRHHFQVKSRDKSIKPAHSRDSGTPKTLKIPQAHRCLSLSRHGRHLLAVGLERAAQIPPRRQASL